MSFSGSLGSIFRGLNGTSDTVRDYTHASRTFRSDNYALLPKTKRWWHITFELNQTARDLYSTVLKEIGSDGYRDNSSAANLTLEGSSLFLSVLAKNVKLPSVKFDTKKYNNYNKQIINIK